MGGAPEIAISGLTPWAARSRNRTRRHYDCMVCISAAPALNWLEIWEDRRVEALAQQFEQI